jgi:hypothetical protein
MKALILTLFLVPPAISLAHPVSSEDGVELMSETSSYFREMSLVYSPKSWMSVGVVSEEFAQERDYTSLHLGWLVQRWNLEGAQGNIYLFGGPGDDFARLGAQVDFETRKIYSALKYTERRDYSGFGLLDDRAEAAFGIAPYLANYSELNTWVIMKVMMSENFSRVDYMPHLRFFYRNFLWEVGMGFDGMAQLNFMVRF